MAVALLTAPLLGSAGAQTVFQSNPATLGAIPDSVGECTGADGAPLFVAVPTGALVGGLTNVAVSMTISHTWMGEVTATLISPDGTTHVIFGRTLANAPPGWGIDSDLSGTYTFNDAAAGNWWTAATTSPVAPGSYRTSEIGGPSTATGAITAMNPVFTGREGNGTWYVRFTDSCRLDTGVVSALSLTLSTNGVATPPVAATPDAYIAGRSTPLVIAAPGVLSNDINSAGSGPLTATLHNTPTHGTVTLNSNGGFLYTPTAAYLGPDAFTYFASNLAGTTAATTVSITVVPVQPPTQFRVDRVVGNQVTLRWDPAAVGPIPTGYRLEGGVSPGTTQGSLPVGPVPIFTVSAPSGTYFLRVIALDGAMASGASTEIPLYVNVSIAPSAPGSLTGLVNNDSLALSWQLTYRGGEPTAVLLDVTSGAASATVPMGPTDTFSFAGVPPGTYTFAVRASNASGVSAASAPMSLTFPGGCSGVPAAPRNFLFYGAGNTANLLWDPPSSGPAPTAYVMNVTGAFVGALPVGTTRVLSGSVPPGTYTVAVTAVNACGSSPATAARTVTIP